MTAANNPNFNPEKYTNIASNHLVVYSIYFLYKDGDEIRAEDIISACFTLFPKKFCLRTYPQWPDSALVGRRLHDCERSGWITARIDSGFKLTAKGKRLAEKVAEELGAEIHRKKKPRRTEKAQVKGLAGALRNAKTVESAPDAKPVSVEPKAEEKIKDFAAEKPKPSEKVAAPAAKPAPVKPKVEKAKEKPAEAPKPAPTVKPEPIAKSSARIALQPIVHRPPSAAPAPSAEEKAKAAKFIKMMEASDAYRLYKKNGAKANIGEFDFRSLLLCTMESSHETLVRNVELFTGYAKLYKRKDLIAFLAVCREKFSHLLTPEKKAIRKLR
jgi:hypothetical protein